MDYILAVWFWKSYFIITHKYLTTGTTERPRVGRGVEGCLRGRGKVKVGDTGNYKVLILISLLMRAWFLNYNYIPLQLKLSLVGFFKISENALKEEILGQKLKEGLKMLQQCSYFNNEENDNSPPFLLHDYLWIINRRNDER